MINETHVSSYIGLEFSAFKTVSLWSWNFWNYAWNSSFGMASILSCFQWCS